MSCGLSADRVGPPDHPRGALRIIRVVARGAVGFQAQTPDVDRLSIDSPIDRTGNAWAYGPVRPVGQSDCRS
jgi:hypothetical protein